MLDSELDLETMAVTVVCFAIGFFIVSWVFERFFKRGEDQTQDEDRL